MQRMATLNKHDILLSPEFGTPHFSFLPMSEQAFYYSHAVNTVVAQIIAVPNYFRQIILFIIAIIWQIFL